MVSVMNGQMPVRRTLAGGDLGREETAVRHCTLQELQTSLSTDRVMSVHLHFSNAERSSAAAARFLVARAGQMALGPLLTGANVCKIK